MSVHVVAMGVSGSGKSTVAEGVVARTGWVFAEADAFHPQANIDKMSQGIPLTDEDRWPWLHDLGRWMAEHAARGEGTVITCSALRRVYRDVLREEVEAVGVQMAPPELDRLADQIFSSSRVDAPAPREADLTPLRTHDPRETDPR